MTDATQQAPPETTPRPNRRGARNVVAILAGLAALMLPFAWSLYASYAAYRDYVKTTLEVPAEPPAWVRRSLTADDCVNEALAWTEACPGFDELCRRALPTVVGRCLASRDRRAWCEASAETLGTADYGVDACRDAVGAGRLEDTGMHRQRCAIAYRAVSDWCEAQPPPPRARVDVAEP